MKKVVIAGGGVAGLASAVFLANKGFEITLLESSPKLGGRCYSFLYDKNGFYVDNGKHLIAGWYESFIEFLRLIGSENNFRFQEKFRVSFLNKNGKTDNIYFSTNPFGFLLSFLKSDVFSINDLLPFYRLLKKVKNGYSAGQTINAYQFIKELGFSENTIDLFWEPVSVSIFNTKLQNVAIGIFTEVMRRGFGKNRNYLLGFPISDFYNAFIKNTELFLQRHNISVMKNTSVKKINITGDDIIGIETDDLKILKADYYILATPHYTYRKIFRDDVYEKYFPALHNIKTSSIINLHMFFKNRIPSEFAGYKNEMLGFHNPFLQWVFVNSEKHLNITISGADEIFYGNSALINIDKSMLFDIVLKELKLYIKCFNRNDITEYVVIKEKRATYMPDFKSIGLRKLNGNLFKNIFFAGDWTNEYLPSTLESAALSGKICAGKILNLGN